MRLRLWADRDLPCVEEASRDPVIPEGTTVPAVFTPEEGMAWLRRQRSRHASGEGISLAITDRGTEEAVGACVLLLRSQSGSAGIGYWLVERARGRGLASRAVALASSWALREGGVARVEALVEPGNIPSRRTVERAGFHCEGLLRSYLAFADRRADAVIYSLLPADLDRAAER